MNDSRNKPECECADCNLPEPANRPPATMGFNSAVIKPETRVNKTEDVGQHPKPTPEEIKAGLRERHELGCKHGDDRLHLDALELIESLEKKYQDVCRYGTGND